MSWRTRVGLRPSARARVAEVERTAEPAVVERASPGLAALFDRLKADGRHSVLDLGPAHNRHLQVLGPFARQIRFAGLVPKPPRGDAWAAALSALPPNPARPYDVVLAWDLLDRIDEREGAAAIGRLADVTAPGARLYAMVDSTGAETVRPVRVKLLDRDRVAHEFVGPSERAREALLPAHVERMIAPFTVVNAFSLRLGLREYVAVKA